MMTHPLTSLDGKTIGEIAAALPGATAVFRRFKLDFCCHGDVMLVEAARRRGVDLSDVRRALNALDTPDVPAPASLGTEELIDHILTRYHDVHRREITELVELARKVEAVHAAHPGVPRGLAGLLHEMRGDLEVHMQKEELILFPAMRRSADSLDGPIAQMRHEHDNHSAHLQRLEALVDGGNLPEGACSSWQALYVGIAKLVEDLMEHIHLENNVLFTRFQQVAQL